MLLALAFVPEKVRDTIYIYIQFQLLSGLLCTKQLATTCEIRACFQGKLVSVKTANLMKKPSI